ncbi:hypothetical protein EV174_004950, partial [Coemansia sp. RSA 2320]
MSARSVPQALPQSQSRPDQYHILRTPFLSSISAPHLVSRSPAGHAKRALHATVSRLLACLVNEQLVDAHYVDLGDTGSSSYIFITPYESAPDSWAACSIISQITHKPVVDKTPSEGRDNVYRVRFLDPEDIGVDQWIQWRDYSSVVSITDATQIMQQAGEWMLCDSAAVEAICSELTSSVNNQMHAYAHSKPEPNILSSTAIEWEQSIVEGHATHPMHRARYSEPPLEPISPDTNMFDLALTFIAVPRSQIKVIGELERLLSLLYANADAEHGGNAFILDSIDCSTELAMPVHPLHLPAVLRMFSFARHLPFTVPAKAQASLRTVCPSAPVPLGYDIKLPLGIKVTSALRTISPWSAHIGPHVTNAIPSILRGAPVEDALLIAGEPASAVSVHSDYDVAKYLSCVIRNDPEHICRPRGERVILAAALTNNVSGISAVVSQWSLDTKDKRCEFLRSYTDMLFDAFLPPIMNHGFAFEAHPQNCLLRIGAETGDIRGFIVRDFGGIKVHRPTFIQSTGADISMLPDSSTEALQI